MGIKIVQNPNEEGKSTVANSEIDVVYKMHFERRNEPSSSKLNNRNSNYNRSLENKDTRLAIRNNNESALV